MTARTPLPDGFSDGPFSVSAGRLAGIGRARLRAADLARPFHGIRFSGEFRFSVAEYARALGPRLPLGAFFSHSTAAQLLGIPLPHRLQTALPLHVGVSTPSKVVTAQSIVGHRLTLAADDLVDWRDLRITGPARTWLDLAALLDLADLVAAGDYVIHWEHPLVGLAELTDAASRYPGRRGLVRIRAALPLLRDRAESPRESKLRVIIVLSGLPEPLCNFNVFDSAGRFVARGDLAYPQYKLLLEYHGDQHRTDRAQWRRDIRRLGQVEDEEWQVLQFTDDDLQAPGQLVARIERRLRGRGWTGEGRLH